MYQSEAIAHRLMYLCSHQKRLSVWLLLLNMLCLQCVAVEIGQNRNSLELDDASFLRRQEYTIRMTKEDPADDSETETLQDNDGEGADDDKPAVETGPALNPPANPFLCDDKNASAEGPSLVFCKGLAESMTDNAKCWTCYPSYRNKFCEKEAIRDSGPNWVEKCALEKSIRDVYCKEFAETKHPELQESCFYEGSEYKGLFCLQTQTNGKGFEKRCAQDAEQGATYCKDWAEKCAENEDENIFLTCKNHKRFMEAFCNKQSTSKKFDARCADINETGSVYCMAFVDEETVRGPCAKHEDYLSDYCDARANAKADEDLCATSDKVKVNYCHVLAMKKTQTTACWDVEKFAEDYCNEVGFDSDPKCAENQSPPGEPETSAEKLLEEEQKATGELPDNYFSESSLEARKDHSSEGAKAAANQPDEATGEITLLRERASKPSVGDVPGMDAQLPPGWRSGWDEENARFFFFPVEEDEKNGAWRPVEGGEEIYEKPEKPWRSEKDVVRNAFKDEMVMTTRTEKPKLASHSSGRYFPSSTKSKQSNGSQVKQTKSLIRSEKQDQTPLLQSESFGIMAGATLSHEQHKQQESHNNQMVTSDTEQHGDLMETDDIGQGAALREAVLEYQGGLPAKA